MLKKFLLSLYLLLGAALAHAASPELLPPEQAFHASAAKPAANRVLLHYTIAEGYFLYRERFKVSLQPAGAALQVQLPPGKGKQDEFFGWVETYRHGVDIVIESAAPFPAGATLVVTSQGCADAGICYPPQTWRAPLSSLPPALPAADAKPKSRLDGLFGAAPPANSAEASLLRSASLPALLAFFFVAGLSLAFTACMYPLLPIVAGIVVGRQGQAAPGKLRGFALTFAYVQGMALTYALAGVLAALSGSLLSSALQQPWVLAAFAVFLALMALSMFGLYQLQLPSLLQSRFNQLSNRLPGGQGLPVLVMGALSALIIGPCVAPPLAAALGYIGGSGDVLKGGLALYSMALGIGAPLLVVGVFGGHVLPKAGGWMNSVRQTGGVAMLLAALWIVSPILPSWLLMLLLALLLIGCAMFLHALEPLPASARGWKRLWKGLGVALLVAGVSLLLGLLAGSRDLLQPLRGLAGPAAPAPAASAWQRVGNVAELDAALAAAKAAGQAVVLDYFAEWCVSCKELERFTFADPAVATRLRRARLLQADVTAHSAADKALLAHYGLFGPPATLLFAADGHEQSRLIGFEDAAAFLQRLDQAGIR